MAVILAAGRGTRLGPRGRLSPKGLLEVDGRTLIQRSLDCLRSCGISDVVLVTGHLAEQYHTLEGVRFVHNARFAETGSLGSLACARGEVRSDCLLLESDLLYERRALTTLLEHPGPDAVLLSGPTGAGDEVWVEAPGGRLKSMSKDRTRLGEVTGELVGISRISADLFAELTRLEPHLDYETGGLVACAEARPIACPVVLDLAWAEVDDEAHLLRARQVIAPRLRGG
ncbi:MAG: phosphocholine cytidylyltransferase family protein [Candidatus Eremiobacterota bacterium]